MGLISVLTEKGTKPQEFESLFKRAQDCVSGKRQTGLYLHGDLPAPVTLFWLVLQGG